VWFFHRLISSVLEYCTVYMLLSTYHYNDDDDDDDDDYDSVVMSLNE